jgi:hypothetical protein
MTDELIVRLSAANPVPDDRPLHELEAARIRRSWRPLLGVAVALVAFAGAGVAVAAGFGAFDGTPAPPDVSANFAQSNKIADLAIQEGFGQQFPQADVSKAHGVIEIQTPDGPQDLWAAPNDQGGQCYFIDFANDPVGSSGGKPGSGECVTPDNYGDSKIAAGTEWGFDHPDLVTINGSVAVDAATVKIVLQDGSTLTAPVVEHLFLASIPKPATGGARLEKLTAFDANGTQVAEWTPPQ